MNERARAHLLAYPIIVRPTAFGHAVQQLGNLAHRETDAVHGLQNLPYDPYRHPADGVHVRDQAHQTDADATGPHDHIGQVRSGRVHLATHPAPMPHDHVSRDLDRHDGDVYHLTGPVDPAFRKTPTAVGTRIEGMDDILRGRAAASGVPLRAGLSRSLLTLGAVHLDEGRRRPRAVRVRCASAQPGKLLVLIGYVLLHLGDEPCLFDREGDELGMREMQEPLHGYQYTT